MTLREHLIADTVNQQLLKHMRNGDIQVLHLMTHQALTEAQFLAAIQLDPKLSQYGIRVVKGNPKIDIEHLQQKAKGGLI